MCGIVPITGLQSSVHKPSDFLKRSSARCANENRASVIFYSFITYRAKLLNADWFRQRALFLNFPSMEGKITRS